MKVLYIWYSWDVTVYTNGKLYIASRFGNNDLGYKTIGREYDIPVNPKEIKFDGSYVNIYDDEKLYQFKLEGDSCIVGDVWKDGELFDSVAMWDLWDDFF